MPKRPLYRSKVKIGVDADGKPINKWIQGRTKAALREAREAVIARYITGTALTDDRLFGDYASEWYRIRKEPFISASSRESYRSALNRHLFPVLGDRMLRSIGAMELQELLNSYAGKSKSLITNILATLRGVFGSAMADRLISSDPTDYLIRPTARPTAVKPALTAGQRAALEEVCRTHPQGHYLALLYYLGCRPGEARGLMWQDVDWSAGLVHIERDIDYKDHGNPGALKNRASDRHVPMPEPLRALLQPLRGLPDTYIAHAPSGPDRPLSKSSADRLWLRLMDAAGMTVAPPEDDDKYEQYDPRHNLRPLITPHALRHNYITMCWEHGFDPYETMTLVGHASITTTMNIYTHLSEAQMSKTAAKLDDMFRSQPVPKVAQKLH
ncbi:MAG: site-specific integrase [Clostridia bacterium]|nr:site-specific integrase [Clostridia bacterium]